MKILEGNLKDFRLTFNVIAFMPNNSQKIECFKLFEFINQVAFSISFCPSNHTLVFRYSVDNSFLNVQLQDGHARKVIVIVRKEDKSLWIRVFDGKNYKSKTLEFAKLQEGFEHQLTIFNGTKEHLIKVYDFYCGFDV